MTKLKEARLSCNTKVTQQDLAELLNVSQSTISKLERDKEYLKRIPLNQAMRVSDLLGIEVKDLYE